MLKRLLIYLFAAAICLSAAGGVGCGGNVNQEDALELSDYTAELTVGEKTKISITQKSSAVYWNNSDENVCVFTADADGIEITALSAGKAYITARCGNVQKTITVTVSAPQYYIQVAASEVVIDLDKGESKKDLGVTLVGLTWEEVYFRTDNYAVAVSDDRGVVTGKRAGVAQIFIGSEKTEELKVTITVLGGETAEREYPLAIDAGRWPTGHVQGIAVDKDNGYVYYTFTTVFVKTDFYGNVIGSFSGYEGHLGDCTYNPRDGKVYSSLSCNRGEYSWSAQSATYVAVIDVDKITHTGMDAYDDDLMKTVFLREPMLDYYTDLDGDGKVSDSLSAADRKYGVCGIDGICFGPKFGTQSGNYLTVAYCIAKNENRNDNDYLVFVQYDVSSWYRYGRALDKNQPHTNGPEQADGKYFLYTGNTDYGVQTMDYDAERDFWVCVTYNYIKNSKGNKAKFYLDSSPDTTFLIDNKKAPVYAELKGQPEKEYGNILSFVRAGRYNAKCGVYSWTFYIGNTGIAYLGNDLYYVAEHAYVLENGKTMATATVKLYRYTGSTQQDEKGNDLFAVYSAKS